MQVLVEEKIQGKSGNCSSEDLEVLLSDNAIIEMLENPLLRVVLLRSQRNSGLHNSTTYSDNNPWPDWTQWDNYSDRWGDHTDYTPGGD